MKEGLEMIKEAKDQVAAMKNKLVEQENQFTSLRKLQVKCLKV